MVPQKQYTRAARRGNAEKEPGAAYGAGIMHTGDKRKRRK